MQNRMTGVKIILLIVSLWSAIVAPVFADDLTPRQLVEDAVEKILAKIDSDKKELEADQDKLYALVHEIILPSFDFTQMSRSVIAKKYWRKAPKKQRTRFVKTFRAYLVKTYSTALIKFDIQKVKFLPTKVGKRGKKATVRTKVFLRKQKPVPIDYRMYKQKSGDWKVYDIKVDGISLVVNNRKSYGRILKKKGFTGLIKRVSAAAKANPAKKKGA
jgi:phospholipid transport system substrate-binding protein